jgi:IS5 family transposase
VKEQVPELIRQASERILSGRQVASEEKILSNHEPDIRVIKRGKAGKEVEFGNHLFLAESREGLIVDHELYKDYPGDAKSLEERLEGIRKLSKKGLKAVCADRQFDSEKNREELTGEATLSRPATWKPSSRRTGTAGLSKPMRAGRRPKEGSGYSPTTFCPDAREARDSNTDGTR